MKKERYIVTIDNGDDQKIFTVSKGERLMLKDRKFIVVGETPLEDLPSNIRIELLTKNNKYKVKKLTKK